MTQEEKKLLACQIIGDGQTPNKFFVTTAPWVTVVEDFGSIDHQILDGWEESDTETEVFETYEEAKEYFENIELDHYSGVGQILLEDRLTGIIIERSLEKIVSVDYTQREFNDAKQFGYEK
jgi:hypothetical protein